MLAGSGQAWSKQRKPQAVNWIQILLQTGFRFCLKPACSVRESLIISVQLLLLKWQTFPPFHPPSQIQSNANGQR